MTYYMIIIIWAASSPIRKEVINYPVHSYEYCLEVKDSVKEIIEADTGFKVATSCPVKGN